MGVVTPICIMYPHPAPFLPSRILKRTVFDVRFHRHKATLSSRRGLKIEFSWTFNSHRLVLEKYLSTINTCFRFHSLGAEINVWVFYGGMTHFHHDEFFERTFLGSPLFGILTHLQRKRNNVRKFYDSFRLLTVCFFHLFY